MFGTSFGNIRALRYGRISSLNIYGVCFFLITFLLVFQVLNVPAIIANKSVDVSLPLISKKESVMKMDPLTNLQVI